MGIGSANPLLMAASGGDTDPVTRSLRFDGGESLSRTFSSTGDSKKFTFACWVKRTKLGGNQRIFQASNSNNDDFLRFNNNNTLGYWIYQNGSHNYQGNTTAVFRDVMQWTHVCYVVDTAQATAANRVKIFVNGVSHTLSVYPDQNRDCSVMNTAALHYIGRYGNAASEHINLYIADAYFLDGEAVEPVDNFIESNGYGGYKPKAYTGSFGTNGFHIDAQPAHDAELLVSSVDRNDGDTLFADAARGLTITRSGNTHHDNTVGNPFDSSGTAMYFDGSGDYLQTSTSSDLTFGTGDFTVETWLYPTTVNTSAGYKGIISDELYSNTGGWAVSQRDDELSLWIKNTGGSWVSFVADGALTANQWQHIAVSYDSSTTTTRLFVDGTSVASGTTSGWNLTGDQVEIGRSISGQEVAGYFFDVRATKGTARYTSNFTAPSAPFELNPIYIGGDQSGNKNHWDATNIRSHDIMLDTPTKNYATLNPLDHHGVDFSEGNLDGSLGTVNEAVKSTIAVSSGKWYWEVLSNNSGAGDMIGIAKVGTAVSGYLGYYSGSYGYYKGNGYKYNNASATSYGNTYASGDIIGVALDLDNGTLEFYKNNSSQGTAFTGLSGEFFAGLSAAATSGSQVINFGADPTFAGNKTSGQDTSQSEFFYAPPTGFKSLNTSNLDDPTVSAPSHFNTVLYTGTYDSPNGYGTSTNSVSGMGFSPELLWIKDRDNQSSNHGYGYHGNYLFDSVQGTGYAINTDGDRYTGSNDFSSNLDGNNGVSSFTSPTGGFTLDGAEGVNYAADSDWDGSIDTYERYVAWGWKLGSNGSSSTWASGNTDPTTEKYNASAGVSVIRQEETSSNYPMTGVTVNHSLGAAPEFAFLIDVTSNTSDIFAWHKDLDANKYLKLNQTSAQATGAGYFPSGCSTATTFQIGGDIAGANGMDGYWDIYLYLFSGVEGFSRFGSYTGNSSSNGPFVYTGFRPRFLMIKRVTSSDGGWKIMDTARDPYNDVTKNLYAYQSNDEDDLTSHSIDLLSNGFKWRTSGNHENANGHDYIYACFAESPFKYANAR